MAGWKEGAMEKASVTVVDELLVVKPSGEGSSSPPEAPDKSKDLEGLPESNKHEESEQPALQIMVGGSTDVEEPQPKGPEAPLEAKIAVEEHAAPSSGHGKKAVNPPPLGNFTPSSPLHTVDLCDSTVELSPLAGPARMANGPADAAKSDMLFPPGELIFARSEYYPHYWPGVIADPR